MATAAGRPIAHGYHTTCQIGDITGPSARKGDPAKPCRMTGREDAFALRLGTRINRLRLDAAGRRHGSPRSSASTRAACSRSKPDAPHRCDASARSPTCSASRAGRCSTTPARRSDAPTCRRQRAIRPRTTMPGPRYCGPGRGSLGRVGASHSPFSGYSPPRPGSEVIRRASPSHRYALGWPSRGGATRQRVAEQTGRV